MQRVQHTAVTGMAIVAAAILARSFAFWAMRLPPAPNEADSFVAAAAGWLIRGEWEDSIWRR